MDRGGASSAVAIMDLQEFLGEKFAGLQQALNKTVEKSGYQEARLMSDNQSAKETQRLLNQFTYQEKQQLAENKWSQDHNNNNHHHHKTPPSHLPPPHSPHHDNN